MNNAPPPLRRTSIAAVLYFKWQTLLHYPTSIASCCGCSRTDSPSPVDAIELRKDVNGRR
ncbi:hypothetical protein B0F90DRAFT_1214077 [Multifurca ochricompacta]|uniref:Uncharacterized protein n=1 Tax=Multifurca ochricompacta TaxID=376703 RepID=A0AAD4LTS9_9AGAM|nr:hypothetical protein B0F90DRAFT_1214077 [Multifurca ochricompacta]